MQHIHKYSTPNSERKCTDSATVSQGDLVNTVQYEGKIEVGSKVVFNKHSMAMESEKQQTFVPPSSDNMTTSVLNTNLLFEGVNMILEDCPM